jgi:hypothetical protein
MDCSEVGYSESERVNLKCRGWSRIFGTSSFVGLNRFDLFHVPTLLLPFC